MMRISGINDWKCSGKSLSTPEPLVVSFLMITFFFLMENAEGSHSLKESPLFACVVI